MWGQGIVRNWTATVTQSGCIATTPIRMWLQYSQMAICPFLIHFSVDVCMNVRKDTYSYTYTYVHLQVLFHQGCISDISAVYEGTDSGGCLYSVIQLVTIVC